MSKVEIGAKLLKYVNKIKFIEITLIILFVLISLSIAKILPLERDPYDIDIPIPATYFIGGIGLLTPGKWVEISVYKPNEKATPVHSLSTGGEVRRITITDDKPDGVVIAIPKNNVEKLQKALIDPGTKITYQIIPDKPTVTPSPTDDLAESVTPPAISLTPTPKEGNAFLDIDTAVITSNLDKMHIGEYARIVIIYQPNSISTGTETPNPLSSFEACIKIEDFLDGHNNRQGEFNNETKYMKIQIETKKISEALKSIYQYKEVYLILDFSCQPEDSEET